MLEFILLLQQRYQAVLPNLINDHVLSDIFQKRIEQLSLAQAFIKKSGLIASLPQHPLQIAMIGPTQAGKSTLVNLLLDTVAAGVSPLAGYTVHAQGFCVGIESQQMDWLSAFFDKYACVTQQQLNPNNLQSYSVTHVHSDQLKGCMLWDTPDFDSIDAADYRTGVLKTIALADIIVLAVSKEKYADQSVWEVMSLLQSLQQPTLILLNKVNEAAKPVILNSLQEKWRQARLDKFPEAIPLPYSKEGFSAADKRLVHRSLDKLIKRVNRKKHALHQQKFLKQYWQDWTEPLVAEHNAYHEWSSLIEHSIDEAMQAYKRDYLDHPNHYETFQNALAEMLTLLEIPGLATAMAKTRRVLTWPVRKMLQMGGSNPQHLANTSQEVVILKQIAEHLLIQLSDRLLDKIDQDAEQYQWWKDINLVVRQQRDDLMTRFHTRVLEYHADFQLQVEQTAQSLYQKLQEQPLTLNSLRATRFTTDAAAVALAVKTGGIGLHDLVITPAMLSMTSYLAESAIGSYVTRQEVALKRQQFNTVKEILFIEIMQTGLERLPILMDKNRHFNISPTMLEQAEKHLTEKPHGLRIL